MSDPDSDRSISDVWKALGTLDRQEARIQHSLERVVEQGNRQLREMQAKLRQRERIMPPSSLTPDRADRIIADTISADRIETKSLTTSKSLTAATSKTLAAAQRPQHYEALLAEGLAKIESRPLTPPTNEAGMLILGERPAPEKDLPIPSLEPGMVAIPPWAGTPDGTRLWDRFWIALEDPLPVIRAALKRLRG